MHVWIFSYPWVTYVVHRQRFPSCLWTLCLCKLKWNSLSLGGHWDDISKCPLSNLINILLLDHHLLTFPSPFSKVMMVEWMKRSQNLILARAAFWNKIAPLASTTLIAHMNIRNKNMERLYRTLYSLHSLKPKPLDPPSPLSCHSPNHLPKHSILLKLLPFHKWQYHCPNLINSHPNGNCNPLIWLFCMPSLPFFQATIADSWHNFIPSSHWLMITHIPTYYCYPVVDHFPNPSI